MRSLHGRILRLVTNQSERVLEIAILPESDLTALGLGEPNNRYMMESRASPL